MSATRDDGLSRNIERVIDEQEVVGELVELDHKRILDLGCGRAQHTRAVAAGGPGREVVALEVDEVQHRRNLALDDLPNVRFGLGGAESVQLTADAWRRLSEDRAAIALAKSVGVVICDSLRIAQPSSSTNAKVAPASMPEAAADWLKRLAAMLEEAGEGERAADLRRGLGQFQGR